MALLALLSVLAASGVRAEELAYSDKTLSSGIVHSTAPFGDLIYRFAAGTGIALFDANGDGALDVVLGGDEGPLSLYLHVAEGTFSSAPPGEWLVDFADASALAPADFDNDGDIDLAVTHWDARPFLWRRDGATWTEVGEPMGLLEPADHGTGAAWCDLDGDGFLDLIVARYAFDPATEGSIRLYRNLAGEGFEDLTEEAGLTALMAVPDAGHSVYGLACVDVDADGDPDIFVANDHPPAQVWRNHGSLWFTNAAAELNLQQKINGMGVAVADFNGDQRWDLFVTDTVTHIMMQAGCGPFTDVAPETGTEGYGWGWAVIAEDLDQDGWLDLFIPQQSTLWPPAAHNLLLLGQPDGSFEDVAPNSDAIGPVDFASANAAAGDLDGDGDLDLIVTHRGDATQILRNDGPDNGNWLVVDPEGTVSNRDGIGARVEIQLGDRILSRLIRSTSSFYSTNPLVAHFGLGAVSTVPRVTIRWPSGVVQTITDVAANQTVHLVEAPLGWAPPLYAERCGDDLDNDCDGATDFADEGLACTAGAGACLAAGVWACADDLLGLVCTAEPSAPTPELCGDTIDNDCDGLADEGSWEPCLAGIGACQVQGKLVCGPAGPTCDAAPPAPAPFDICDNGVDDDCDGITDSGAGQPCTVGLGECQAQGEWTCAPDGLSVVCSAPTQVPMPVDICGDGLDNDCDGATDEGLGEPCSVGVGACQVSGVTVCDAVGLVCDAHPTAPGTEVCGDGIDNDCDGATDEGAGAPCSVGVGACVAAGVLACAAGELSCTASALAPAPELCGDAIDNDCDGVTDEGSGEPCVLGQGACATIGVVVCEGALQVCAAPEPAPAVIEVCGNGVDDDCDGATDEGLGEPCTLQVDACVSHGVTVCGPDGMPSCSATQPVPAPEVCGDGLDNDCDGATDEGEGDACVLDVDGCALAGTLVCDAGSLRCDGTHAAPTEERCGDALDNDCDGATDEGFEALGQVCTYAANGCVEVGHWACAPDGARLVCAPEWTYGASEERCGDGLDNDCDGATDEGFDAAGQPCVDDAGAAGTWRCDFATGGLHCAPTPVAAALSPPAPAAPPTAARPAPDPAAEGCGGGPNGRIPVFLAILSLLLASRGSKRSSRRSRFE